MKRPRKNWRVRGIDMCCDGCGVRISRVQKTLQLGYGGILTAFACSDQPYAITRVQVGSME
jgi:hypothetical protein